MLLYCMQFNHNRVIFDIGDKMGYWAMLDFLKEHKDKKFTTTQLVDILKKTRSTINHNISCLSRGQLIYFDRVHWNERIVWYKETGEE